MCIEFVIHSNVTPMLKIIIPDSVNVNILIPSNYVGKQIEVLLYATDEPIRTERLRKIKPFTTIKSHITEFTFNRDELNER